MAGWLGSLPDLFPRRTRPSVPARLVVLGIAVAVHSVFAQLLYGGWFVKVHAPLEQLQRDAELMYYGGDITEMLLAVAPVTTSHPVRSWIAASLARSFAKLAGTLSC